MLQMTGVRADDVTYPHSPLALWEPATYRIVVQGRLSQRWTDCFGHVCMSKEQGLGRHAVTMFLVRMADQAALLGALNFLYGMGLPLLLVECIATE